MKYIFLASCVSTDPPAAARFRLFWGFLFKIRLSSCAVSISTDPTINKRNVFLLQPPSLQRWRSSRLPTNTAYYRMFSPHSQRKKKKKKMSPSSSGAGPAFASATRRLSLRAVTRLIRQNIYNLIIKGSQEDNNAVLFSDIHSS